MNANELYPNFSGDYTAYGFIPTSRYSQTVCGFHGQRKDSLMAVYWLGNGYRAYSPILMRFLSPDNVSPFEAGGINAYVYCEGDPINNSDPTGHMKTGVDHLLIRPEGAPRNVPTAPQVSVATRNRSLSPGTIQAYLGDVLPTTSSNSGQFQAPPSATGPRIQISHDQYVAARNFINQFFAKSLPIPQQYVAEYRFIMNAWLDTFYLGSLEHHNAEQMIVSTPSFEMHQRKRVGCQVRTILDNITAQSLNNHIATNVRS
ncbi:RHS repeat-associated core domain-containing protein [Pseudomonas sp. SWRI100]|uniref:RHS repeat-associated core domain-containing protein n=1 Tax=Pseudomonas TaxID=286 RepID=UPI001648CC30|nr:MULTISPECIES: RHS repeat-associated core domain-containing protein [Pseudomonas]MBC3498928.1 RHS repeat-associated core domain-containing protein [Pseudomonas sp. SWRI67]MBV4526348.1 RHS repeat-associated core domain-containing protein [Pseudomonas kermanshahensis]